MLRTGILVGAISISSFSNAGHYKADNDGCWWPDDYVDCVSASAEWKGDGMLRSRFVNNCHARIYISYCNGKNNGREDCGASGLNAGNTKTWDTYNANGKYRYEWIGSQVWSKDWVCNGKLN